MQGLNWQTVQLPFAAGLQQKADDRARPQPFLDLATDVQFDELGGLQTRYPYQALSSDIAGGGTITNARRLFSNGDELLLFTDTALYSWDAIHAEWVLKATHLAAAIDESARFVTTGDQVDADRAELGGVHVYAWVEGAVVYVAALEESTGAVLVAPAPVNGTRPRLVALSTKILLFFKSSANSLVVTALDPTDVLTGVNTAPTPVLATPNFNDYYDVVRIPAADTALLASRRTTTTSYTIAKITAALVVTTATPARTADGPLAISVDPTGATAQVLRANGTNIQGDRITVSTLADAAVGQAVGTAAGTPVNQIAACHRSVQNAGAYRCYAFWSSQESITTLGFQCKTNYVDTAGSIGTESVLRLRLGVASRAFDYGGQIYVWTAFGGQSGASGMGEPIGVRAQLQNTYFLYRDDGLLVAKAASSNGGGFSASTGHLPGITSRSSRVFSWCGIERRVIELGGSAGRSGYAARAPHEITVTFDDDRARRCVRLGRTVYVAGGLILQYDGNGLYEVGFLIYPWLFTSLLVAGAIPAGKYSYQSTLRWDNAVGERERSTTASGEQITSVGAQKAQFQIAPLHVTRKANAPAIEMWRTALNPTDASPFYLATGLDPAVVAGDNAYLANAATSAFTSTWSDNLLDAALTVKEANPENGGLLESLAPPAAGIISATADRVFLADVAGDPDRVWYSRQRQDGEVASFHEQLTVGVPRAGGRITAIAVREDALIVWRETATYVFPGIGFDNSGQGQNFGPVQVVSTDVGATRHEAVALTDRGYLFKSAKGWFVLAGLQVQYVGAPIVDHDTADVYAISVIETQHQIRIIGEEFAVVLDTVANQWAEWSIVDALDAVMWQGGHAYLTSTGVLVQTEQTYANVTYGVDVATAWIKLADLQGAARVRRILVLGEWVSAHHLRMRIAYDYNETYVDDVYWTPSPGTPGPFQFARGPSRQQCQAIKIRLTAVDASNHSNPPTSGAALKLTGLGLELGFRPGLNRRLPVAQKVG